MQVKPGQIIYNMRYRVHTIIRDCKLYPDYKGDDFYPMTRYVYHDPTMRIDGLSYPVETKLPTICKLNQDK